MPGTDRQRGTLLGLAIGDALGAAVEFEPPGTFPEVTGYRGGGPHGLAPGEWTDDTSMALALADSIASVGWDLNDQARRYVAWWREGRVLGQRPSVSTSASRPAAALSRFEKTGDARTSGDPRSRPAATARSCGWPRCRSAMPTCFPTASTNWSRLLVESSLPTHASPQCLSACAYMGLVLGGLIQRPAPRRSAGAGLGAAAAA